MGRCILKIIFGKHQQGIGLQIKVLGKLFTNKVSFQLKLTPQNNIFHKELQLKINYQQKNNKKLLK